MNLRFEITPIDAATPTPEPREGGIDAALIDAVVPAPGNDDAIARLRDPSVLAVTTGQQPGLLTGPLYTIHKALSAVALATELERRWERPVVPIFWVASDDHDFAEASQATWTTADGAVQTGALRPRSPDAPLTPMYREPLGDAVNEALRALADGLPESPFRETTLDWLGRHWQPQATVGGAFAGSLAELLAPLGVICVESAHQAVKRLAAPIVVRALERAHSIDANLAALAEQWRAEGREPTVGIGDGATTVMVESVAGRDRLVIDGGGFATRRSRERFTLDELRRLADADPQRLSPNVLLRPVVESALIPTVAYVAGPGELAYLALTPPLYAELEVPRQIPVPRWSGVLVEPKVDRIMEKFGVSLGELLEPAGALERRLVRSQLSPRATDALAELRSAIERGYEAIGAAAEEVDPTLARPVQGARNQALAGTQDIEKKLMQHLRRRQETELSQLARARNAVSPLSKPQERVLTVAPFLARYGPTLLSELLQSISAWYADRLGAPAGDLVSRTR